MSEQSVNLSGAEQLFAVKTWRYLRLAMVALVLGLAVSIAYEYWKVDGECFQTSISAYYYTPVRGYLVGALVSVGVCLFCLKGSKAWEDILLNLAGLFAPLVALVPTPGTGTCGSILGTTADRNANIANNVTALLAVGFVGLAILAFNGLRGRPTRSSIVGFVIAVVAWGVTAAVFWLDRSLFVDNGHYTAAVLMFVCFLLVVASNALGFKEKTAAATPRNRYGVIAAAMVASVIVIGAAGLLGWDYWILLLEAVLITLFAVFWVIQTIELWDQGLRAP
jgi:hypothetical protein